VLLGNSNDFVSYSFPVFEEMLVPKYPCGCGWHRGAAEGMQEGAAVSRVFLRKLLDEGTFPILHAVL